MDKKTFDREIEICRQLSKKNNGSCKWGICKNCGVIPFLYKLHKGELLEDSDKIKKLKDKILL